MNIIPNEITLYILNYLDVWSMINLKLVNVYFSKIITFELLEETYTSATKCVLERINSYTNCYKCYPTIKHKLPHTYCKGCHNFVLWKNIIDHKNKCVWVNPKLNKLCKFGNLHATSICTCPFRKWNCDYCCEDVKITKIIEHSLNHVKSPAYVGSTGFIISEYRVQAINQIIIGALLVEKKYLQILQK